MKIARLERRIFGLFNFFHFVKNVNVNYDFFSVPPSEAIQLTRNVVVRLTRGEGENVCLTPPDVERKHKRRARRERERENIKKKKLPVHERRR